MLRLALSRILAIPSDESVHLILPLDMTTGAVHTYLIVGKLVMGFSSKPLIPL